MADLGLLSGRSAADASSAVVATFAAADADRDGRLNEKEFAAYYRKATAPRLCDILEAEHPEDTATLRQAYANWAAFGIRKAPTPKASGGTSKRPACMDTQQLMGSAHWLKLCRDTKLVGPGRLTTTDADLIFAKVRDRGHQRVSFPQFVDALGAVAARLKVDLLEIVRQITLSEGPVMNGTTVTVPQFYVTADARASVTSLRRSSGGGSLKPLRAGTPSGDPMRDLRQSLEGKVGAKTKGSPAGSLGTPPSSGCTIPAFHHETPVSHAATPEVVAVSDAEAVLSVYAAFAGFGMGSAGHGTTPSPLKVLLALSALCTASNLPIHKAHECNVPFINSLNPFSPPLMQMEMDSKQFAKLAKDAALSRSSSDAVAVDLCFAKVKARGARRIGFADFLVAIALLAQEKGLEGALRAPAVTHKLSHHTQKECLRYQLLHMDLHLLILCFLGCRERGVGEGGCLLWAPTQLHHP